MSLQRRLGVRFLNYVGDRVLQRRAGPQVFQVETLEDAAKTHTGLSNFGSPRYRVPLERLCESYRNDAELTFLGRMFCQRALQHLLVNRLKIQRDLQQQPEILQQPVRRPLFVLGLPRTGTTLLFNLLAQDPTCRPLLFWESFCPAPPPRPETRKTDPRIAVARSNVRQLHRALPELASIHEFHADGPEECLGLLMNTFFTPFFRGRVPLYREWLDNVTLSEVDAVYAEYREQLQLLQSHISGDHWLLKCPSHLWGLSGLMTQFPDACIVQTHRELEHSIPSLCSLTATVEQICYADIPPEEVGQRVLHIAEQLVQRGLAARDSATAIPVHDVHYREVTTNPIATVRQIYERFGYPYTADFERRMEQYLEKDRATRRSTHRYSLEQFGLSQALIEQRFAGYRERLEQLAPSR